MYQVACTAPVRTGIGAVCVESEKGHTLSYTLAGVTRYEVSRLFFFPWKTKKKKKTRVARLITTSSYP